MSLTNFRSLTWKFTLFYFVWTFCALFMARSIALLVEFHQFRSELEHGWLVTATEKAARVLGTSSDHGLPSDELLRDYLGTYLTSLALSADGPQDSKILAELAHPLSATVTSVDSTRKVHVRFIGQRYLSGAQSSSSPIDDGAIVKADSALDFDETVRQYQAPLYDAHGQIAGYLDLEVRIPAYLWQVLFADSLEWLDLVKYMIIFVLGSGVFLAMYLNRRLRQIETVAALWETGDLSASIKESSNDEFGHLARRLNQMINFLRGMIDDRSEQATLKERQRLARGLHDTIKQRVLALNLQLATALRRSHNANKEIATSLNEARQLTREIQDQLVLVVEGSPTISSPETFVSELRRRTEDWSRRGGFQLRSKITEVPSLSADQYECIIAIIDEALANVMRHSGATTVDVYLDMIAKNEFEMIVADDGAGSSSNKEGMGIRNMRERASQLPNGLFVLSGKAGYGTEVIVTWRANRVRAWDGV